MNGIINQVDYEKRLYNQITFISFIYSILVIMIHSYNLSSFYLANSNYYLKNIFVFLQDFLNKDLASIAVPSFFMFSGFLFYRNVEKNKVLLKIKKRKNTILIPYLVWNIIYFTYFFIFTNVPILAQFTSSSKVELTFMNIFLGIFLYKYNSVFWYLFQTCIFILLSPFIIKIVSNKCFGIIVIIFIFVLNMLNFKLEIIRIDSLFYYLIGAFVGKNFSLEQVLSRGNFVKAFSLTGIVISQIIYILYLKYEFNQLYFCFLIVLIISMWFLTNCVKLPKYKGWMTISFFIYASHILILRIIHKGIHILINTNGFFGLFIDLCIPVFIVIIIIFSSIVIKNFFTNTWNVLNGGR